MAISYLSTPTPDNPYIVPFDLNIMAKVNMYKQSQFYQNAEKLSSQFTQLNSLDIGNEHQRNYAQRVVGNLENQVNSMGGMDFSDPTVTNTISNYAGDVYSDQTIMNGIVSTKNIRSYNKNTEDMKTNPKLSKYYDAAREWYDKYSPNDINPQSQANYFGGDINSTYSGPTAPTPSLGSDWDILVGEVQKLHPNIVESINPLNGNKFFLDKSTNSEVSEYTIRNMIDGKIDGRVADQLKVHAAYNYHALSGGQFSEADGALKYEKSMQQQHSSVIAAIEAKTYQIPREADKGKQIQLQQQLKELTDLEPQAKYNAENAKALFSQKWQGNKVAAMYELYTGELKDKIAKTYSYSETKHQLITNQEAIMDARWEIEAAKLNSKVKINADGSRSFEKNKPTPEEAKLLPGQLQPDFSTDEQLKKDNEVSFTSLQKNTDDIYSNLNEKLRDMIFNSASFDNIPGLISDKGGSINNDGSKNAISHPDILRKVAQMAGNYSQLEMEDLRGVVNAAKQVGVFDENGNYINNKKGTSGVVVQSVDGKVSAALTAPMVGYFKKVLDIAEEAANGGNITGKISLSGQWKGYIRDYTAGMNAIQNNKHIFKLTDDAAIQTLKEKGYNDKEINVVKKAMSEGAYEGDNLPVGPGSGGGGFGTLPTSQYKSVFSESNTNMINRKKSSWTPEELVIYNKMGSKVNDGMQIYKSESEDKLKNLSDRKNYYNVILEDDIKDVQKKYGQNILNYIGNSPSFTDQEIVKTKEDIDPSSIVTDGKKYYIKYGSKAKPYGPKAYVELDDAALANFNIQRLPHPELENPVRDNGELYTKIMVDPTSTGNTFNKQNGFTGPIKVDVRNMNPSAGRNSNSYTPVIMYNGHDYFFQEGNSNTVNGALGSIESALQNNSSFYSLDKDLYTIPNQPGTFTMEDLTTKLKATPEEIQKYIASGSIIYREPLLKSIERHNLN